MTLKYKKSLTYILNHPKQIKILSISKVLDNQLDLRRFKIFSNKNWKKTNKTNADFSLLIDKLSFQCEQSKQSFTIEVNEIEFLENILNEFNSNPDFDYHEKLFIDLLNFIKNDTFIIINEKIYPKTLFSIFNTIRYHNNLISDFLKNKNDKNKNDKNKKLKDKGTAFAPNRDATEVTIPIKKQIDTVKKILENNIEVNGISNILKNFNKDPYSTIVYLSVMTTDIFQYLKDDEDKKCLDVILKIKKVLNASQGLKKEDFIHSMKFTILSFIPYKIGEINYGFDSKEKLRDFLNEVLEFVANINFMTFDVRDFNQKIQIKDRYKDNPIYEKITNSNLIKDPIYDNPIFIKEIKFIIKKSLKIHNNKFQRKKLSNLNGSIFYNLPKF
jgi:hypothetical protein